MSPISTADQFPATSPPIIPRIMLAPMQGVVDYPMRLLLTGQDDVVAQGGYDRCVSEFVRVTDVCLPERVFFRHCPELAHGCVTESGVPVYVQLLGSNAPVMAANARRLAQLGAAGIDLNFGCPAKTVNRSNGGSILLRDPACVARIVRAVREAVPAEVPVSAKIRLGYESRDAVQQIAGEIGAAGASELCVHARSKADGYRPPAYWSLVKAVSESLDIPVIINGEIWSVSDALEACDQSGCHAIMLGRGALSCPDLAAQIRAFSTGAALRPRPWSDIAREVLRQFSRSDHSLPRYVGNRTKQWLAYLRRQYPGAERLFSEIKPLHEAAAIHSAIEAHLDCTAQVAGDQPLAMAERGWQGTADVR